MMQSDHTRLVEIVHVARKVGVDTVEFYTPLPLCWFHRVPVPVMVWLVFGTVCVSPGRHPTGRQFTTWAFLETLEGTTRSKV